MALTTQEIKEILAVIEASEWDEVHVTIGDVSVAMSRNGGLDMAPASPASAAPAPPAPAAPVQAPEPEAAAAPPDGGHVVTAPSVGVWWRAPEPGAPPFVEVGAEVQPGDTLGIVEVMKLMNQVVADVAGTVSAIHCANGQSVEFDSPLVTLTPA